MINKQIMDAKLYDNCFEELKLAMFNKLIRIMSYEYNKMQDEDRIISDLEYNKKIERFGKIITTNEYLEYFDKKYCLLVDSLSYELKNLAIYQREICINYKNESYAIESILIKKLGKICGIECSKGDLHNGKSVAIVSFENGNLIYKPRNEANTILLKQMVDFLSSESEVKDFKFTEFYTNGNHSWEKIILQEPCKSIDEVEKYYYRAGVYLAAFYFLGSFDMHHENVISSGQYPVIIDTETITKALLNDDVDLDPKDLRVSVLNTSFIPYVNDENVLDVNISAIFSEQGESKRTQQILVKDEENNVYYEEVNIEINEEKNIVNIEDMSKIDIVRAREKLISGFYDASRYAINNKSSFMKLVEDFCNKNNLTFRQLLRSTQVYYQFIYASNHPEIIQNEVERDDLLGILSNNFVASKFGFLRVQHEISELKRGNIPLYYSISNSCDLYSNGTVVCKNYFKEAANETILNKIRNFDDSLLEYQVELIKKSIAIVQTEDKFGYTVVKNTDVDGNMTQDYLTSNVKYWVDYLKKMEFKITENNSTLLSLRISKNKRLFSFDNLTYELYENGMFPLFMLYYGKENKDKDAIDCSVRLTELLINNYQRIRLVEKNKRKFNLSVYTGIGALMYTTYNFYKVTNNKKYLNEFIKIALDITIDVNSMDYILTEEYLYLEGVISSLYLICKIYRDSKCNQIYEELKKSINKLIHDFEIDKYDGVGFAHGIGGIAVAFSEFYRLTYDEKILDIVYKLILKENYIIDSGTWEEKDIYTWCNGKSGILLTRKLIYDNLQSGLGNKKIDFEEELNKYNSWIFDDEFFNLDNMCLCHGTFGNIEIAKYLIENDKNEIIMQKIRKKYFEKFEDLEWIKGFDYNLEQFMLGNMGIAYVMLELLFDIPSILALELYDTI
ncbi:type 2 lantibiotic biosynthesis LanM family protein [[Clostridium] bifermentans ATCC 19299]|nr:type 2 lantibiotic biosynthesis LanM family protein [[Clostridium] bifermentans ATCC 19299] [Paraclostridium bifermentans ATCC 19299]